ncbi:T9SS type A sorting domain-containing protein [Flavobacterium restrictum]|uniref:T9SS type A sorting domain-containing protein n=1 Tax=Flavobacterium restrictum TaxID=2594428 RepID=A0A553DQX4_9FLAO|nr:T9SS type A sorting domain-containing protein [Flavobacterium restrictum]TRX35083.1 T9SS type A sorting domain-containing protein [Flavobacterium restrictum]
MKKGLLYLIMCVFAMTAANAQIATVSILGEGVGGWPGDPGNPGPDDVHQMTSTDGGTTWTISGLVVTGPGIKFRANNSWNDATGSPAGGNWGAPAAGVQFPTGIAVNAGSSSDIKVGVVAGIYDVTLDVVTGAYSFNTVAGVSVVKLSGTALASTVTMATADSNIYTYEGTFTAGTVQFDIDGVLNGGNYPTGNATPGSTITVPAGDWVVSIDLGTGDYTFTAPPFKTISITGNANIAWGTDTPLTTTDGINYSITDVAFKAGGFIFRENNSWSVKYAADIKDTEFFATTSGNLSTAGQDFLVTAAQAGTYDITVNRQTLAYTITLKSLGLNKLDAKSFSVYPNPSQGAWNITSKNNNIKSVQVYDINGRVVRNTATTTVDGTTLAKGIYFAKVTTENASATVKLIKN